MPMSQGKSAGIIVTVFYTSKLVRHHEVFPIVWQNSSDGDFIVVELPLSSLSFSQVNWQDVNMTEREKDCKLKSLKGRREWEFLDLKINFMLEQFDFKISALLNTKSLCSLWVKSEVRVKTDNVLGYHT